MNRLVAVWTSCLSIALWGASCEQSSVEAEPEPEPQPDGSGGVLDRDGGTSDGQGVPDAIGNGFPDETTTGPRPGTVTQSYTGLYEVRTEGAVVSGIKVTGAILVYADNVTIEDCEVDATGEIWGISGMDVSGLRVTHCRV
jgi:hypothetical protein